MAQSATYRLANGVQIPVLGFGTILPAGPVTEQAVATAVKAGYRLFDTAAAYHNESSVGRGLQAALNSGQVTRGELFMSGKVWYQQRSYQATKQSFAETLAKLQLDYLDLYLIHWPANARWHQNWQALNAETWRALEDLYHAGQVRAIGVSNFSVAQLQALQTTATVLPQVNQIEYHPDFAQVAIAEYCQQHEIVVEAWRPFGGPESSVMQAPVIRQLAALYQKQPAQIILRWLLQKQIIPLPKSSNPAHAASNTEIFDFELTAAEMLQLDQLNRGTTSYDPETYHS
ncbi:aldo/keto reductase [Lapidilactobacillus wuchangensis]|uniref:aldo/keto reductase n=1 Tax=Lapidilactobacillus wuchangensis TaxID=2486001 RepID=UPI000F78CE1A|nr:aldo/keto reductase [Lapidilactobacillus wuchangensis]